MADEALEFLSNDLHPVTINSKRHTVAVETRCANRPVEYHHDLGGHPLSDRMCEFLLLRGPSWPASTVSAYCNAFTSLLRHLQNSSYRTLSGESFGAFIKWLNTAHASRTVSHLLESTRRGYSTFVLKFMEWLADVDDLSPKVVFAARARHQRAFRGSSARKLEQMRLTAVSPDDYVRLVTAIRREYEECKRLLERSSTEQEEYDATFPLLPFSLLLGAELALRPEEFNYLNVNDVRGERLLLNPPNKESSEVWLSTSLTASLELARQWMLRYNTNPRPDDPLLVCQLKRGRRSKELVRFDTILLNQSVRKFYKKYFDLIAPEGSPYLYGVAEDDESVLIPFRLPFKMYRSAAITEGARHERNPTALMRFARHASFDTTIKFYIRETHQQWMLNVARSLAPSAELLRISLENEVANPEEEEVAKLAEVTVPGGHCEQALSGDRSCRRATDCRLCAFFRIHVSKREFFVREREDALERAVWLQNEHGLSRDAQNLRELAALNQAVISRIDDHLLNISRNSMDNSV